jgi:hypothetical protein
MYKIHRYIFDVVFEQNMDMYRDFIGSVRNDYIDIVKKLSVTQDILVIRQLTHKMISVIALFEDSNNEMIYYCRLLLNIDKSITDYSYYSPYIEWIITYDKKNIGL